MAIEINKAAIPVDVVLVRGDDFTHTFRIGGKEDASDPTAYWNLDGWELRGQVRKSAKSADVLATITVTAAADQDDPANTGKFTVSIQDSEGPSLGSKMFPATCVGDIEFIDPDGNVRTYFSLNITAAPDVTRVA